MNLIIRVGVILFCWFAVLHAAPAKLERTLKLPITTPKAGTAFAILLTGDGGWAELARAVGARLSAADIPTVGWDSRAYYWTRRSPDEAARDLTLLIRRFRKEWNRPRVVLVGYSRGADVLPFLVNRLPKEELQSIELITLLGPAHSTDFEIHLLDYLGESKSKNDLPVPSEIAKLKGLPLLILYGDKDTTSCGAELPRDLGDIHSLPGDHHFAQDYERLLRPILERLRKKPAVPKDPG